MSKYIQDALIELVNNFAERDEDGNWWGFDTNVGEQRVAFEKAERQIVAGRRPNDPIKKRATMSSVLPKPRKVAIAKAIFGKDVPAYWYGSRGEHMLLRQIMEIKGFKEKDAL